MPDAVPVAAGLISSSRPGRVRRYRASLRHNAHVMGRAVPDGSIKAAEPADVRGTPIKKPACADAAASPNVLSMLGAARRGPIKAVNRADAHVTRCSRAVLAGPAGKTNASITAAAVAVGPIRDAAQVMVARIIKWSGKRLAAAVRPLIATTIQVAARV